MNTTMHIGSADAGEASGANGTPIGETYRLAAVLDMKAARQLKAELQSFLVDPRHVIVDAAHVERMSTACIQIIVGFFAAARRQSMPAALAQPSRVFSKALEDLGLSSVMEQWAVEK